VFKPGHTTPTTVHGPGALLKINLIRLDDSYRKQYAAYPIVELLSGTIAHCETLVNRGGRFQI
jgi:hypothetical protein